MMVMRSGYIVDILWKYCGSIVDVLWIMYCGYIGLYCGYIVDLR